MIGLILFFQLVAVLCVWVNHIPITLLKGLSENWPAALFGTPAFCGIDFLFLSSGFLIKYKESQLFSSLAAGRHPFLAPLARRFTRLALPAFAALILDWALIGFNDLAGSRDALRALPFEASLSHTFYYKVLGHGSLAEPMTGSNMTWLSADLFFLCIFYSLTRKFSMSLPSRSVLWIFLATAAAEGLRQFALVHYKNSFSIRSAALYGDSLGTDYTLHSWLQEYSPYAHILNFCCGVVLGRIYLGTGKPTGLNFWAPVLAAMAMIIGGIGLFARPWGISVVVLILIVRYGQTPFWERQAWPRLLGRRAYELFVLHLILFIPMTLDSRPGLNAVTVTLLCMRVLVGFLFSIFIIWGLSERILDPMRSRINRWFHLENIDDVFV